MDPIINLYNEDCLPAMKKMADNQYSLAIVDPPYGIGYENGGQYFNNMQGKKWDKIPAKEYFEQLFRISKNQIIWGGNYFSLPSSRGVIAWTKTVELKDRTFSEWEMAWTSFNQPAKWIDLKPFIRNNTRINPCQKPVQLYKWLLKNYAKPGDKILDTHFGSLSIGIACWDASYDLDTYEIDKDYFEDGKKRLEIHKKRPRGFFKETELQSKNPKLNKFF